MTTFTQADSQYRRALEAPGRELASAFAAARQVAKIDLQGNDITQAVLSRMKSFFATQDMIKTQLSKVYAASAADFFVENILFYLKIVLERIAPQLAVNSEKNIVQKRGSIRPDISIWRDSQVVAAIECKTQLGWNRNNWLRDFEQRELKLKAEFPDANLFLLVMTAMNWPGFGDDPRVGKQFFVILHDTWPRNFAAESSTKLIAHRLEELISILVENAK